MTAETLRRQRNYLLSTGFPRVVEFSKLQTIDNTLLFMADLDRFVDTISTTLKTYGEDVGHGVFSIPSSRIRVRLDINADDVLDELEAALQAEGLSSEQASAIRDQVELLSEADPRFELDGATVAEPADLAAAIVTNVEDRAEELIANNQTRSSGLHAQPRLSVSQLAADLHYGVNSDPLVPAELFMAELRGQLSETENKKLEEELDQLERREQVANFLLVENASSAPETDADFDALAAAAQNLYEENLSGPGIYGTEPRLNEPEIAYQLQRMAEQDPGRALGVKWMLEGLMDPDQRAELDRALAGEASFSDRVDRAIMHPGDGFRGAGKSLWNNTVGWLVDDIGDWQTGVTYGAYGMATGSNPTLSPEVQQALPQAPNSLDELDSIVELEFEMNNIAEQGGEDIVFIVDVGTALYGGGRGGLTLVRVGRRYFLRSRGTLVAAVGGAAPFNTRGQIPRAGARRVFTQTGPTCGPTSCGMSLDTLGYHVDDLDEFVRNFNVQEWGTTNRRMVNDLKRIGVDSTARFDLTIEDIATYTRHGNPMIVHVNHPGPNGGGHFVVVDGITTRYGRRVVAIRDPHGRQYFEDLATFEARSTERQGLTFDPFEE